MNDPFVLVMILICAVGSLLGGIAGWYVRSVVRGCVGLLVLLIAVVGGLVLLFTSFGAFEDDDGWGELLLFFFLFLFLIIWFFTSVGWGIARAFQANRGR